MVSEAKRVPDMTHDDWSKLINETALPASFQPAFQREFLSRLRRSREVQRLVDEHFGVVVPWHDTSDGKLKYQRYLLSEAWQVKVKQVAERSSGWCERCDWGLHEHTHHKTYDRLFHEELDDLVAVCSDCHAVLHQRSEWDPKKVEAWERDEQARFLKTVAVDRSFRKRLTRLLVIRPQQPMQRSN